MSDSIRKEDLTEHGQRIYHDFRQKYQQRGKLGKENDKKLRILLYNANEPGIVLNEVKYPLIRTSICIPLYLSTSVLSQDELSETQMDDLPTSDKAIVPAPYPVTLLPSSRRKSTLQSSSMEQWVCSNANHVFMQPTPYPSYTLLHLQESDYLLKELSTSQATRDFFLEDKRQQQREKQLQLDETSLQHEDKRIQQERERLRLRLEEFEV